jgi:lactate permease
MIYDQNYSPLSFQPLGFLVAALPVIVLFYLLVIRRVSVPWAAAGGAAAALIVAVLIYRMPADMAGLAFLNGALFGLMPICWTIANAMLLYNITVETGRFEKIKNSVAGLSADHRLQAVLIAFAFGAFLEGAAGGGTPVAICAAMLVGLGFNPFLAAGLCLIANTSPVAYGGFGTPILTLQSVTNLDAQKLSEMAGNQLPFLSCIVPFWLVRCMCGWKETFEVWPAVLMAGGSFAICQYLFSHSSAFPLTDIGGGLISLIATAIFLRYWRPRRIWRFDAADAAKPTDDTETAAAANKREIHASNSGGYCDVDDQLYGASTGKITVRRMSLGDTLHAWMPFIVLCVLMTAVGVNKKKIDSWSAGPVKTYYELNVRGVHEKVRRTPPVVETPQLEKAQFKFNWLTTPGTSVFLTAMLMLAVLRVNREQRGRIFRRTYEQMRIPVPTIVFMLGLGSVTRLGGLDATMGMAFKNTGMLYPFFAAILGWLGVFLTGTDAASNALFGSLQKITAIQLHLNPILITVANSTGGVMGKMIDAQSICVATAATERVGTEADIFKFVIRHSIVLAAIVGLIVMLQAYVWPFTLMVPNP